MARTAKRHTSTGPSTGVVIYCRVSTEEQAREGLSLEVQRARCLDYARALGLEVLATHEDAGRSGRSLQRPGVQSAIAAAIEHRAALLVYALDRLTRSVRDLGALLDEVEGGRFELVSVTDNLNTSTAAGRLVVHVLGAVAQWQREAGNERVRDALAHARDAGAKLGRLPLGLKRGSARDAAGRLVVELDEQGEALRARVWELAQRFRCDSIVEPRPRWKRGAFAAVARQLNREGRTTAQGAQWRSESVRRVLLAKVLRDEPTAEHR